MSDYYKEYYQKNKEKILFRVKNNYMKKKFNKYEQQPTKESNIIIKKDESNNEPKKEEEVKDKIKKNIIVSFF